MRLAPGARLGPYEIVGWIGAGGMGEVYRARDPRLARDVAIKLLPEAFASDGSRLRRFEQEARAVGQLSHPNILAVYDIGTHDGAPFIVSEFLEGASLREKLEIGPLPPRKAIDYARQIIEGLAAAHDKGIVHRDLKPDNLFIANEGRVKILDFGIAKLTRPPEETIRETGLPTETEPGVLLGTVGYMSPEQLRGDVVDHRSDLFSFGTILYEMLTGFPAFARATTVESMAAILKEDPPELFSAGLPPALGRIISRCLEKTREARFQSARDVAFGLDVLSDTDQGKARAGTNAELRPRRLSRTVLALAVLALILFAAVAVWLGRGSLTARVENPLGQPGVRFTPFTDWEGTEARPEISPDGRFVVFLSDRDGEMDLWSSQVGTGVFKNLTVDLPPLGEVQGILRIAGFTGDGTEVWFNAGPRRMLMPLTGGPARPFLGLGSSAAAWSPDGTRMVFFTASPGDHLSLADPTGANAQPIEIQASDPPVPPEEVHNHNPIWSPDGQWIYFVRGVPRALNWTDEMDIWRVRPSGASPERLTHQQTAIAFLAPIDDRTVLYTARAVDGSGPWLWSLDVPTKVTNRASSLGVQQFTSVAASRDGRRVVATAARPTSSLWRVPLRDHADESDVRPYEVPTLRPFAPRFGGTSSSLFYLSASETGHRLWHFHDGRASEVVKSTDGALSEPPAVSRDGKHVALVLRKDGKQQLAIMSADGTDSRRVAASVDVEGAADWSRDGQWIVIGGRDAKGPALFKIPVEGGEPIRLVTGEAANPIWSPKDTLIVYSGRISSGRVTLFGVRPDGSPVELPEMKTRPGQYRFLPDGSGLVYLEQMLSRDFSRFDFSTNAITLMTKLGSHGLVASFDVDPEGKFLVFERSRENSDIVLIDLPKK
jgi:Tol biopolymer transport system component